MRRLLLCSVVFTLLTAEARAQGLLPGGQGDVRSRASAAHAAIASSVNQTVRLPR